MHRVAPPGGRAAEERARGCGALAGGTRVRVVSLPARSGAPRTVKEIVAAVGVGQSTVAAHLKRLAEVGFVRVEHWGTASLYRTNAARVETFPTAADLVMGRPVPTPDAWAGTGRRASSHRLPGVRPRRKPSVTRPGPW